MEDLEKWTYADKIMILIVIISSILVIVIVAPIVVKSYDPVIREGTVKILNPCGVDNEYIQEIPGTTFDTQEIVAPADATVVSILVIGKGGNGAAKVFPDGGGGGGGGGGFSLLTI